MRSSFDDQIGPREEEKEAPAESTRNLKNNKTMIAGAFADESISPELLHDVKTLAQAFQLYEPGKRIEFEDAEGNQLPEDVTFTGLPDFTQNGISAQSKFLQDLELDEAFLGNLLLQVSRNRRLQTVLQGPETKAALLEALDMIIAKIKD